LPFRFSFFLKQTQTIRLEKSSAFRDAQRQNSSGELAAATITAVPAMHAGHIGLSSMDSKLVRFHFTSYRHRMAIPLRELVQDILWFDAAALFLGHAHV
jgi:hypothetical protein